MKRRAFCAATLAAATTAGFPISRLLAAAAAPVTGEIPAVTGAGKQIALAARDLEDLRASLRGHLLLPGQEGYEPARKVWNGMIDRRPALIVRCAGAADVIAAVNFARAHDLALALRGGGHSPSGQSVCAGGLVIDSSTMNGIRVDPALKVARVEPGSLLGDFDREAQAFGLATTAGTISHTGIAGLTLGGGMGRICRKFGLTCDNVRAVDIVPASGQLLKASAKENPDLFWGLRGGGGNFGVVTSFEYQLHTIGPTILGGMLVYPLAQAREVLGFLAGFSSEAPDELNVDSGLFTAPDGQRIFGIEICYCGTTAAGERALKPLRDFRKPLQDTVAPMPYVELQRSVDGEYPHGRNYYVKGGLVNGIEPALIEELVGRFESSPLLTISAFFAHLGGAVGRVAPGATAFWQRRSSHNLVIFAGWDDRTQNDPNVAWVRSTFDAVERFTDGFYVNDIAPDDPDRRVKANYGGNYERLVALKNRYDATNLFRLNANVRPRAA